MYNNAKTIPGENLFESYESVIQLARGLWDCQNSINHKDLLGRSFCKNESNKVYPAGMLVPRTSPYGPILVEALRTIIGPK